MTEKWKSNPMYWCDYCKVWMQDNPSSKATHERGLKHKENVARKLRQMRQKADSDKKEAALAEATMSSIEAAAKRQYEKDLAAADAVAKSHGEWAFDEGSKYFYNAAQRYYYSRDNGMYYGGDPPAWTTQPDIPPEALFKSPPSESKAERGQEAKPSNKPVAGPRTHRATEIVHPLANLGGYSMPEVGKIGGMKGVGTLTSSSTQPAVKRKREDRSDAAKAPKAELSEEERRALAAREAARTRVQQRTMQNFGLGL